MGPVDGVDPMRRAKLFLFFTLAAPFATVMLLGFAVVALVSPATALREFEGFFHALLGREAPVDPMAASKEFEP